MSLSRGLTSRGAGRYHTRMKRMTRREAVAALLTSAAGLSVVRYFAGCASSGGGSGGNGNANDNRVEPDLLFLLEIEDIDHVEGDPNAPDTIIEYADFECPICGDFFRENRPAVIADLVDTGQARFVFRHFPISTLHPNARLAAIAAECAVDFFEYHDLLFENQDALAREDLIGYAEQVGLNGETFGNCLDAGSKTPRIERDLDSGTQLEITGTPTFFVNDRILTGNHPVEDFEALLD